MAGIMKTHHYVTRVVLEVLAKIIVQPAVIGRVWSGRIKKSTILQAGKKSVYKTVSNNEKKNRNRHYILGCSI